MPLNEEKSVIIILLSFIVGYIAPEVVWLLLGYFALWIIYHIIKYFIVDMFECYRDVWEGLKEGWEECKESYRKDSN